MGFIIKKKLDKISEYKQKLMPKIDSRYLKYIGEEDQIIDENSNYFAKKEKSINILDLVFNKDSDLMPEIYEFLLRDMLRSLSHFNKETTDA